MRGELSFRPDHGVGRGTRVSEISPGNLLVVTFDQKQEVTISTSLHSYLNKRAHCGRQGRSHQSFDLSTSEVLGLCS